MSRFRHLPLAGLAAASAVAAAVAQAASPVDAELEELIVTARSLEVTTPLELARYGYDVEFVSSRQIKDHGFVDLPQALEMLVPGAYVAPQSGAFSYVNLSLQGSRNGDVLWTVDGVRMNNRLYNTTSPADTLPASMVERLEVMKGGHGLLYGTQAVAGVINVVTRAFSEEPDGAVSLGTSSRDGIHANAYYRDSIGDHRFVAWASRDRTDGFSPYTAYQPDSTTRDRRYDMDSFGLKYGYEFTDNLRLTLQGTHTEGDVDFATHTSTDVNQRNEEILSARLDYTTEGGTGFYLKTYLHDWDTDYFPVLDPADSAYWGFRDLGISAATKFVPAGGLEYHLGYEFQSYRGRDDYLLIEERSEKAHALFAQLRTTDELSERTRLTAGLRYNDAGGSQATVWSASAVTQVTDSVYIESSLGTSFRLPDAYQLYAIDPFDTRGNPDLAPEKSFNINLAVGGRIDAARPVEWQLTGWKRRISNLIVSDSSNPPAGFDAIFVNTDGKVKASGAELLLRGSFSDALRFGTSYMYSRERSPATGAQLPDRPKHTGKVVLEYSPIGNRWGADVAVKYIGNTYAASLAGFGDVAYGDDIVANLGMHWHADAALRHRIGVRVENLFDTEYATRIRSAALSGSTTGERLLYANRGMPRTVYANYTYNFGNP